MTSLWPPHVGGAENYLYQIYKANQDIVLHVLAPSCDMDTQFDRQQPWETIRIPREQMSAYWNGRRNRYVLFLKLKQIVQKFQIQEIHAGSTLPDGINAWMLHQTLGLPYLVYFYGLDFLSQLGNPWGKSVVLRVFGGAEKLIGCSTYTCQQAVVLGIDPRKIHTIFPGVNQSQFAKPSPSVSKEYRTDLGIAQGQKVIITVARLVARKGHDKVIEAIPKLLDKHSNLLYIVIGDGPNRSHLEQLIEKRQLTQHVTFMGKVSDSDLPKYYHSADIFVMPNRDIQGDVEGFGIVFLEAGAAGLPTIGGKSGGVIDAIADNVTGFLVDPENINEIACTMDQILSNPDIGYQLGQNASQHVKDNFAWEKTAHQANDIIQAMPQKKRALSWSTPNHVSKWFKIFKTMTQAT
ncbi:MAG: glycosyltransferase family 4 protein [Anaerolineales bacterium]|nr:glycosyltransferase family 4 protein [Anaerolineales bacterium]